MSQLQDVSNHLPLRSIRTGAKRQSFSVGSHPISEEFREREGRGRPLKSDQNCETLNFSFDSAVKNQNFPWFEKSFFRSGQPCVPSYIKRLWNMTEERLDSLQGSVYICLYIDHRQGLLSDRQRTDGITVANPRWYTVVIRLIEKEQRDKSR